MPRGGRVALGIVAIGLLALPAPAAAVVVQTTSISMSTEPAHTWSYSDVPHYLATVTADGPADDASQPYGTVRWYAYTTPPAAIPISEATTLSSGQTDVTPTGWTLLEPGDYTFYAVFTSQNPAFSGSQSPDYEVSVGPARSTVTLTAPATVEAHEGVTLSATVWAPIDEPSGSLKFYAAGNPTPLCSYALGSQSQSYCVVPLDTIGTFEFSAIWETDSDVVVGSTSDPVTVNVVSDAVHATNVKVNYSTFYPVRDGYRDTLTISGFREESLSVGVKIYSPSGRVVKTLSAASGVSGYALSWSGRNSSGTILAEGKYKVVQTLTDAHANKKSVTSYVNLSKKHLIWHSSSITKKGSSISTFGKAGGGSVAVNTTSGAVRLRAPSIGSDAAAAGWQFSLPSAVAYKGISVRVYAKHALTFGPTSLGAQDFADCGYASTWDESCFDTWKDVGNAGGVTAWFATKTLSASHRSGRHVRSLVVTYGGTTYVYKARVVFKYAALGY